MKLQTDGSPKENANVIKTLALTRTYLMGKTKVHALRGIDLTINRGEFVSLMGSSGSGKTTLLHLLGCLDSPTSGKYFLENEDVSLLSRNKQADVRNQRIGFIYQTFNLLSRVSALDNVILPLLYRGQENNLQQKAKHALQRVGLEHRADHKPMELSGGERQRVAIARAIISEPSILLADEPTGNLDSITGKEIMQLLMQLHKEGSTLLVVTHDQKIADYSQRILFMQDGELITEGTSL